MSLSTLLNRIQAYKKGARPFWQNKQSDNKAELEALTLLYVIGNRCARIGNDQQSCLNDILDAAIKITGADKGNIQLFNPETGTLTIATQRGFEKALLKYFAEVKPGQNSTCGVALETKSRVVLEDITTQPLFADNGLHTILNDAGVRSVQSTPLVNSSGVVLGIISTHFSCAQRPGERVLRLLDLLAQQAAYYLERKRVEDQLNESEARAAIAVEAVGDSMWDRNLVSGHIVRNDSWKRLRGYAPDEIGNDPVEWADNIHPDDAERVTKAFHDHCNGATDFYREEYRVRCKDGSYRWILDRGRVINRDKSGHALQIIGFETDITDRKLVEAALRDSEERLRLALEAGRMATWNWNLESGEVVWNDEHYRILGYAPYSVQPSYELWAERIHPEDLASTEARLRHSMEDGSNYDAEFRSLWPDGVIRWIEARGRFDRDMAGRALRNYGVMIDVTERKNAELALRESEARLQAVLDGSADAIYLKDSESRMLIANPQTLAAIGKPAELCIGKTDEEFLLNPEDARAIMANDCRIMKTGQPEIIDEVVLTPMGMRCFRNSKAPYRDSVGNIIGLIGIARDVTELKVAEEAVRESEERLRLATEVAKIGAFDWNIQTGENIWTPELEAMYGLSPGEFGRTQPAWEQLVHPDDRTGALAEVDKSLTTGEPVEHEWRVIWPDGSVHWIAGRFQGFKDENNKPMRLRGVNIDITARKQIETDLSQKAKLIELSFEPILIWNMKNGIVEWNRGCEELYGYSHAEALGHSPHNLLKTQHTIPLAEVEKQLLTDHIWSGELLHTTKNGRQVTVESRQHMLEFQGQCLVLETNRDITERKRVEEALRQRVEELEQLLEVVPAPIWVAEDAHCATIRGNRLAKSLYEAKPDENLSANTSPETRRFFTPDGRELSPDQLPMQVACATNQTVLDVEIEVRLPSGRTITIYGGGVPLRNPQGEVRGCIGAFVDITERKQAESELRISEERFRLLFENAAIGIAITDLDGAFVQCNPAYCQLLGYTSEELLRVNFAELIHPDDLEMNLAENRLLENQEQPHFEIENRYIRKDGQSVWVRKFISLLQRGDGKPSHLLTLVTDMTLRRRLEDALRENDQRKNEFLATLAHELRNPLAPLSNGLHLLEMPGIDKASVDKVHVMMARQVNHMVRLVDDLMEVSRITRGMIELHKEKIALSEVLHNAVETSRPHIDKAKHEFEMNISAEPLILEADKVRLAQIITNLLNNAAKYTPEGGKIWLNARLDGTHAMISVRDNGIGIPADMQPKVFDMFTMVDQSTHRAQGGLGIGLTLVHHLVQMHGGNIKVKSQGLNQGSEFVVRLPLTDKVSQLNNLESAENQPINLTAYRILIVDDNQDAADSLALLLGQLNAEVRAVNDGLAALETISSFQPAIVLLDIGMPGMDGYEVARRIRKLPDVQDITIFALTGWGQEEDRLKSEEAGFDHHLVKPVDLLALKELLMAVPVAKNTKLKPQ